MDNTTNAEQGTKPSSTLGDCIARITITGGAEETVKSIADKIQAAYANIINVVIDDYVQECELRDAGESYLSIETEVC